jgi:hypothetical protein
MQNENIRKLDTDKVEELIEQAAQNAGVDCWNISVNVDDSGNVEIYYMVDTAETGIYLPSDSDDVEKLDDYCDGFDIDEEVMLWLEAKQHGVQGVPGVEQLVREMQHREKLLYEISCIASRFVRES